MAGNRHWQFRLPEKWSSDRSKGGFREDLSCYMRSRWEANYARFLNYQGIPWQYEVKTFWFEKIRRGSRSYTPDFWCPTLGEYHEVKGWMDQQSQTKLKRMKKYFPEIRVVVIDGNFFKDAERKRICALIPGWECLHNDTRKSWEKLGS